MSSQKNYYILSYTGSPNYIEARAPHRKEHLALTWEFVEKNQLLLGGAYEEPADGAMIIFYMEDPKHIEEFVKRDPYVRFGVVKHWSIRKWKVVVGTACEAPIRPHEVPG